ncbi:MAG: MerR family transcriptional regulator [Pseudonocardia sp.]|uniref:MerR family transcriptional regulator n=1 Tax=unclassified Pseudonocardia TaxID=2619320 RepID=UPI000868E9CF|nr:MULTISPECIES: MerR family transcriptional regulator [unclassified Pseudonocardia]MBN9108872.1 MerR family transcriptional regulator [Pseudonocardia sp.]ODU25341.1 MAG: MerR family transcriptional regulator [Pseudonocardia sp. SCN 72-51]ODV06906.1 MAG: MerR family transcriptional regulator [Pseudonocardia sp. SCN 73-27]
MTLRSGEVAARAGVSVETLRYYERCGVLPEPARSLGGHREYPASTVGLLRTIKAAQRLGFRLDEVVALLRGAPDLQVRVRHKIAEVEERIAALTAVRDDLRAVAEARCESLVECTTPECPLPCPA